MSNTLKHDQVRCVPNLCITFVTSTADDLMDGWLMDRDQKLSTVKSATLLIGRDQKLSIVKHS